MEKIEQAIIFSAGLGTRFKPWTDHHPKALAPVHGKPLLQRNIEFLAAAGVRKIIVNVHHFAEQILFFLERYKHPEVEILVSDETAEVLETGGGLLKAKPLFEKGQPFYTINVDILTDLPIGDLSSQQLHSMSLATLAVSDRKTSRYFLFDDQQRLSGWRNTKSGEEIMVHQCAQLHERAYSGIAAYDYRFLDLIPQSGKFSIVDSFLSLAKDHTISCWQQSNCRWIDVGKPDSVGQAEALFS